MLSRIPAFASSISSTFSPCERAICFWRANSYIIKLECTVTVLDVFYPLCQINNLSDKSFVIKFSIFNHIQNSVQSLGVFKPAVEALQGHVLFIIFIFISSFLKFASRKETFDAENERKNQFQFDKLSNRAVLYRSLSFLCCILLYVRDGWKVYLFSRFTEFTFKICLKCTLFYINARYVITDTLQDCRYGCSPNTVIVQHAGLPPCGFHCSS